MTIICMFSVPIHTQLAPHMGAYVETFCSILTDWEELD